MNRFRSLLRSGNAARGPFVMLILVSIFAQPVCIPGHVIARGTNNQNDPLDRVNFGSQIVCITPDGRMSSVSDTAARPPNAPAMVDEDTISCALQEGKTTFIIPLPKATFLDRFIFINQNAAACGQFNIAISNSHLPADSPNWTQVAGIIPFAHKRLFNLSLLGIEAKYVKLSFQVEKNGRMRALGFYRDEKELSGKIAQVAELSAAPEQSGKN
jgi:hypothetical protein